MIKINVISNYEKWFRFIKNPKNYINNKLKKLNLKNKNLKKTIIICTLLLSGNKEIRKLNKKFRKKNKSTDVLSFPTYDQKNLKNKIKKEKKIYIGDMIVNFHKIKEIKNIKSFKFEFDKLWIHGLIHLLGHKHEKDKEFKKMNKLELTYLDYIK
jgi:probable rRNA maturation factor